MKQIHDTKAYLRLSEDWESFCQEFLHMSHDKADKQIHLLEVHGPTYFEVAQLTRISPDTYRAIAPAIHDQKLLHNGEEIALVPENAQKVGAVIRELRKTVTVKRAKPAPVPKPEPDDAVHALHVSCARLTYAMEEIRKTNRGAVRGAITYLRTRFDDIERTLEI